MIEFMCAGIFAMANLICKDPVKAMFAAHGQKNAGYFGCMTIAMTLTAMIYVAGPHTGAAVNPAVGIANHIMSLRLFAKGTVYDKVNHVYLAGGVLGGICAGFLSWAHGYLTHFSHNAHKQPELPVSVPVNNSAQK